jgi:hypothetical protein
LKNVTAFMKLHEFDIDKYKEETLAEEKINQDDELAVYESDMMWKEEVILSISMAK